MYFIGVPVFVVVCGCFGGGAPLGHGQGDSFGVGSGSVYFSDEGTDFRFPLHSAKCLNLFWEWVGLVVFPIWLVRFHIPAGRHFVSRSIFFADRILFLSVWIFWSSKLVILSYPGFWTRLVWPAFPGLVLLDRLCYPVGRRSKRFIP